VEFKRLDVAPHAFGEFVWTGFDYIGEPTPFGDPPAPSRSSYFGIIDLAGFKKDRFFIYQARWRPDFKMAHILPHWTWPERVGQVTPVHVYSAGDEAELFVNGKSQGRRKRGPLEYRFRWDEVRYEPGTVKVVVWKGGEPWAEETRRTAGRAARVTLTADRTALGADGRDLAYVTVAIADRAGETVPRASNTVRFTLNGPGDIVGVDNGDATSFEPFQASQRRAYNGLALVIVRTRAGQAGTLTLTAQSDGLAPARVTLTAAP